MPKESPEFFPLSGSFQPVVPLSEIGETPDAVENTPPAPTPAAPLAKRVADGVQARRVEVEEGGRRTPEDEDEETLVPKRRTVSTSRLAPRTARRKSRLPSWRFIVPCLAALLVGGVIGDAFWKNLRRAGGGVEPARVVAEQPPAGVEAPDSRPSTGDGTAVAREPQTAAQASAPGASAAPESAPAVSEAASPKDASALRAEITSATVVTSSARKRTTAESPADEPRVRQPPPSSSRVAGNKSATETRAARPNAVPGPRARGTQNQVLTSSSRDQSLPVFSPPPSDKPGKKEVIQWP
jgi:hypothetical protein